MHALGIQDYTTKYNAATQASAFFVASHAVEAYSPILVWVTPAFCKFKVEHCRTPWQHIAKSCSIVELGDYHAILLFTNTDGNMDGSCMRLRESNTMDAACSLHSFPDG